MQVSQIPCIMTLHEGTGIITGKKNIVTYVINHMFLRPGESSTLYEDMGASFRVLDSKATTPEYLATIVQGKLQSVLDRYYPDNSLVAECSIVDNTDKLTYNLNIVVTDSSDFGRVVLTDAIVKKTNNELNPFVINYQQGV